MQYGLSENTINAIRQCLARHHKIESTVLFGSRAKGNYKNGSDIDLALKGSSLTISEVARLENEIDDLMLPYKFDFAIYHQISNRELLEHIERVGKIFYRKKNE